jgi:hypothetical protein
VGRKARRMTTLFYAVGILISVLLIAFGVSCFNLGRKDGMNFCLNVLYKNGAHGMANKIKKEEMKRAQRAAHR